MVEAFKRHVGRSRIQCTRLLRPVNDDVSDMMLSYCREDYEVCIRKVGETGLIDEWS